MFAPLLLNVITLKAGQAT
ncbi:hypothetical protein OK016_29995 [Vibrio chagasii]|nr:hypothetical protein [Vibrio chagasii]